MGQEHHCPRQSAADDTWHAAAFVAAVAVVTAVVLRGGLGDGKGCYTGQRVLPPASRVPGGREPPRASGRTASLPPNGQGGDTGTGKPGEEATGLGQVLPVPTSAQRGPSFLNDNGSFFSRFGCSSTAEGDVLHRSQEVGA